MWLRQTETGLAFFFKLVSVFDETLVNDKCERLIRQRWVSVCCWGARVTVRGSFHLQQMDLDVLAWYDAVGQFVLTDFN